MTYVVLQIRHLIRVGPAGWSYPDWEGTVYPKHGSKFDHLAYLASFFDTIEINSPFYRIPPVSHAKSWVRRVEHNPDFRFTTKVFRGFTRFLNEQGVGFVNLDQPLFNDSVRPAATVTGPVAYARFHGRNYEKWFAHQESWERYNYLYTEAELEPWVQRIDAMAKEQETYVITNNHFRGQAVVNAGELKRALGQDGKVPPQLREVYAGRV